MNGVNMEHGARSEPFDWAQGREEGVGSEE